MATYDGNASKLLDRGFAEKIPDEQFQLNGCRVWYIPHHGVTSEAKNGKVRVAIECASKLNRISLNNMLARTRSN